MEQNGQSVNHAMDSQMDTDHVPDNVPPTAPAPPLSEFLLNIEDYMPTVSLWLLSLSLTGSLRTDPRLGHHALPELVRIRVQ